MMPMVCPAVFRIAVLAATLLAFMPKEARAAPVTFSFTGTMTFYQVIGGPDPYGGTIGPGTLVSGHYTFDSASTDQSFDPRFGFYRASGPPFGWSVTVGTHHFQVNQIEVLISNDDPIGGDGYGVTSLDFSGPIFFGIGLNNFDGTQYSSDALVLTPPDLSIFTQNPGTGAFQFAQDFLQPNVFTNVDVRAHLDSLTGPVAVSLPAGWILLVAGFGVLMARGRRWS